MTVPLTQTMDARRAAAVLPLFTATLFLSAFLMFAIEPMFTRMVLPRLGGSPAVWNTAVVFFQAMLLAGYLYTHVGSRLLGMRRHALVHGVVLVIGLTALPIGVAAGWTTPAEGLEIPWLIGLLAVSIGLPFFAVSATAPLLQLWFAHTQHARSGDPYFLYGGSNLGSLAALLAYPVLIEPSMGLSAQGWVWSAGYLVLVPAIVACGAVLWWQYRAQAMELPAEAQSSLVRDATWRVRMRWLLLSLAPSALLLGVTLHIATDIASAPFLWVIPLALYLLTFVIAFARRPVLPHRWMLRLQLPVVGLAVVFFAVPGVYPTLVLHLAVLFFTAMVCHGELARLRPVPAHLTEFYLWLSLGGVAGGFLAAIVAPLVFDRVYEYPLALALALLLRPTQAVPRWVRALARITGIAAVWTLLTASAPRLARVNPVAWVLDLALPALLFVILTPSIAEAVVWEPLHSLAGVWFDLMNSAWPHFDALVRPRWPDVLPVARSLSFYLGVLFLLVLMWRRPLRFVLAATVAMTVVAPNVIGPSTERLEVVRTFFGVYSVDEVRRPTATFYFLYNGRTNHGGSIVGQPRRGLTYYTSQGPVGQFFRALRRSPAPVRRIGIIGLGVGSLACYSEDAEVLTYFEIDPEVERLARDSRYFEYLAECGANVDVVLGDGRLRLAEEPDGSFELIVLDAFTGDAIPVHLLTREAIALYVQKLASGGSLLLHVSNGYLDLLDVVADLVADAGLYGRFVDYDVRETNAFTYPSRWVAVARTAEDLEFLSFTDAPWRLLEPNSARRVWTDDYSNVFGALRWGTPPTAVF